jgi:hypothetical protein
MGTGIIANATASLPLLSDNHPGIVFFPGTASIIGGGGLTIAGIAFMIVISGSSCV